MTDILGKSVEIIERRITVDAHTTVSSLWAIPADYLAHPDSAIIIAHGAGNNMHSPFIRRIHEGFAERGLLSVKFNFPYKERGRKAPDRAPLLEATWRAMAAAVREDRALAPRRLFLSGKSMGGRMASHVAAQGEVCDGLVFFGYPLHAANKPEKLRTEHLPDIRVPMLFLQGTRDPLCDLSLLRKALATLHVPVTLHVIEGGDHSFKVLKRLGRSEDEVTVELLNVALDWMKS